jgi:hypothetical protein
MRTQRTADGHVKIGDLYPGLDDEQRRAAEHRLSAYLAIVNRIFGRVLRDKPEFLTELTQRARLRKP